MLRRFVPFGAIGRFQVDHETTTKVCHNPAPNQFVYGTIRIFIIAYMWAHGMGFASERPTPTEASPMRTLSTHILRSLALASMMALAAGAQGCAATDEAGASEDEGASTDDITKIDNTKVKRQSIGNCWIYAVHSWAESLNKRATGAELNLSESYLTYWHWFDQIANGGFSSEIQTGGSYDVAAGLIQRYGMISEGEFISAEAEAEMSGTQKTALDAINASLKSGVLKDSAARRDRKIVRAELNKAFGLPAEKIAMLDKVFGEGVSKTLDRSFKSRKTGTPILRAKDIPVAVPDATTHKPVKSTLQEAIGTGSWSRTGPLAFQEVYYPSSDGERRDIQIRVQRALHDGAPVLMSWAVDFNALTSGSQFSKAEVERRGPGRQGGHMTVITDYQIKLTDGAVLKAGESNYSKAQLDKALESSASVEFFRVKNSWGSIRPDRWQTGNGYHDLMMDYLNGPIKKCVEVNGTSDPNNCTMQDVWWDLLLPAGY
jgi:hypothetical protein